MSSKIPFPSMALQPVWFRFVLPLFVMLLCGTARADCNNTNPTCNCQDIDITCPPTGFLTTYGSPGTTLTGSDAQIALCPPRSGTANVKWQLKPISNCVASPTDSAAIICGSMTIKAPASPGMPALAGSPVTISGTTPPSAEFRVTVTDAADSSITCGPISYRFHSNGGGWGDPHITTVDGINYDFQSAGEFTALRGNGMEIQTRQTPVSTAGVPGANPYTELASCVSIYSAVAARVGTHRVSYQPNISGKPDPSGMQLRVDGELVTLGPEGIDLGSEEPIITSSTHGTRPPSGSRIVKSPTGNGIEIHYTDGTQLIVTPAYWDGMQKWYLNVAVNQTTATEGIMGQIAPGSWLPAIPDGEGGLESLGPKPQDMHERYVALYETFANAWRVTDETSLFDYAPGTSTATFTKPDDWPRENPTSCVIEGEPLAQPVNVSVAQEHCSKIVDNNRRANCEFDVAVTGHPGFAETYQLTEQLQPGLTVTTVKDDKDPTEERENVTFTATVAQKLSRSESAPAGAVQFILDGAKVGDPLKLENGQATWSTSNLQVGKHQVVAQYIPSGFGGIFLASSSPEESHTVIKKDHDFYIWLIILFIIILLIVLKKRGRKL